MPGAAPDPAAPDARLRGAPPQDAVARDPAGYFVDKWLQHEPEMQFAALFCPLGQRARFQAWGALLHELRQARFELREPAVADAKRAWWSEELSSIAAGRPNHPLGPALVGVDAPWRALARAFATPEDGHGRPADLAQSLQSLEPLAAAVAAVEAALFAAQTTPEAARALAVHWRLQQLPQGLRDDGMAGVPMGLLARHGHTRATVAQALPEPLLRDWARSLEQALPVALPGAAAFRRSRARFDQARLGRLARHGDAFDAGPAPAMLWRAWRSARER